MGSDIVAIYRRALAFARAQPWMMALPFACQLARRGLAAYGGMAVLHPRAFVIGSSIAGTTVLLIVTVHALRWWRFDGDRRAVSRLGPRVFWGVAAMMAIQLTDEVLSVAMGNMLARMFGGGRDLFVPAALLFWLFVSLLLFPWYVALLTDDRGMSLRRSVTATRPIWFSGFAIVLGALLPLLIAGVAFRQGLGRFDGAAGWAFRLADAVLVPMLIVTTASAYFGIYRRAEGRN